jgi:5-methylcytosine-specific restriction protein B
MISTQYSYLVKDEKDEAVFFWEGNQNYFFIPQNVYIIGTMNTIDRSVDSFDFALRRRFSWEEIAPDYEVIKEKLPSCISVKIAESLDALNRSITESQLLGRDYQIGHAYALNLENQKLNITDAKEFLWKNFIGPLLQEYFRGLGDSKSNIVELKKEFDK